MATRSGGFSHLVRGIIAAGLTALLLWQSDPHSVWRAARGADWRFIVLACLLVAVDRVLMAYRWWTLLLPLDRTGRPPVATVMRIFFVSTFVGTFLPASVGGDAVRAYELSKEGVGGVDAVASVLMDRLLGVLSILIVAVAGAILARDLIDIRALFPALAVLTLACAAALAVVFSPRAAVGAASVLALLPRGRETGTRLVTAIQRYANLHLPMANVLLCSIVVQILRVLQTYCLGLALGLARATRRLLRAGADYSADRADANHDQRHRDDASRICVALRPRRRRQRTGLRAVGAVSGDCSGGKPARGILVFVSKAGLKA